MDKEKFKSLLLDRLAENEGDYELTNDRFISVGGETRFQFEDYVWKHVDEWAFVPEEEDEDIVEEEADRMYSAYEDIMGGSNKFNLKEHEDGDAYWITVDVSVPDNEEDVEKIADKMSRVFEKRV